ncbi:hypothetical protein [Paenibacillus odorifer]|uniref:hypothetical protein n=1 Tax=Paenibacillus odorifer TaxID=189426 RepID=UPI0015C2C8F7|nr:hypothetical protein [Paenibacillus odorifer]
MKKEIVGWLGGDYEQLSVHDNKKDAERGYYGGETLDNLTREFQGKKVKIVIEIIEE